jgi:murein DD-endopeptidase MepM/ murein hydrolase activator NlpD
MPVGTPIRAPYSGVIGSRIGSLGSSSPRFAGLRLTLQSPGQQLYMAHLSRLAVKAGQQVKAGQILGYSGEANGVAHLHLGALKGNPGRYA